MKTILTLVVLINVMPLQSQSNRIFTISLNGGGFIPVEKFSGMVNSGYNFGIDLETRKNNVAIFAFYHFPLEGGTQGGILLDAY